MPQSNLGHFFNTILAFGTFLDKMYLTISKLNFMKNFTKSTLIIFSIFSFYGCENESMEAVEEQDSTELIQITEDFNTGQSSYLTDFFIDNNKNTQIVKSDGTSLVQVFSDNVMILQEVYNQNNVLFLKKQFEYNMDKKLISITNSTIQDGTTLIESIRTFEYTGNEILSTDVYYNSDGAIEFTAQPNIFTINSNNQITKFEDANFGGIWEATYSNGNLATIEVNGYGNKDGSGIFNYTNQLVSDAYQKEKFRFGPQWKLNVMLYSQVGGYSFKQLAELGANYLSGYSHVSADGNETISLTANYEFDENDRLIRQVKTKQFFASTHVNDLTYTYQ